MSKKMDDSLFEDVKYDDSLFEDKQYDDSLFEDKQYVEPEEMGALEAAVTGGGMGASFGLTPIVAGMTGVAGEAIEDVGDVLGLTEDSKLGEQGFDVKDEYEGLGGLMDAYYAQRDRQRAQEAKAFEDQPLATMGGAMAGGLASSVAAAPLAGEGALAQILPKAESVKGMSALGKMGVAAREGAKAGALAGFGGGEAKLGEGKVLETIGETAATGLGGAALGGLLSGAGSAGKGLLELASDTPLAKNVGLGWKAAEKGINISDDAQIENYVQGVSSAIRKSINENFKGASKKQLLEQADEIGIRVSAGEAIEDVITDIQSTGALKSDQKQLSAFVDDLKSLSSSTDLEQEKLVAKAQEQLAKRINKESLKGAEVIESGTGIEAIDDLVPRGPEGVVASAEAKLKFPPKNQWSKPKYKDIITQASKQDEVVPLKTYDLDSMTLSELDELTSKIGTRAYEGTEESIKPFAKSLYAKLREISNNAMENSSLPEKNRQLKELFNSLEALKIKPSDFFSKQESIRNEVEKKIVQKLTASPLSGSNIDMKNFLKHLSRVDNKLSAKIKADSEFASDIAKFVRASEGEGSVSLKAAAGPVQKILAKVGNLAGTGAKKASEGKRQIIDNIKSLTPETVQTFTSELSEQFGEQAMPYINQLNKAVMSPPQRKNALMYSMYQQPAFRKMLEGLGSNILGTGVEAKERDNYVEDINDTFDDDIVSSESEKKSREPQSESPSTSKKVKPFFTPQTKSVDLKGVDKNLLKELETATREAGYDTMQLSSGRRGLESTHRLLESRKEREGIDDLDLEEDEVVDKILLRGDSPDNIKYPKGDWYPQAMRELKAIGREDLIDEIANIRKDFGGYQSTHLQGKKVDIPYSYFINKFGEEEGLRRIKEYKRLLELKGFKVIDEKKAGLRGVLDISK